MPASNSLRSTPIEKFSKAALIQSFDRAMKQMGPYEPCPHIGVAVSGGADSMALVLLADRWAQAHGGRVTALTVDHGLRKESRKEALTVRRWLKRRGINHHILTWTKEARDIGPGPGPGDAGAAGSNLQARARAARYGLMESWCLNKSVLHLLLGHHRDDQAETFLMRLSRGSGLFGLAAMASVREKPAHRLLRPLLDCNRVHLESFLKREKQIWVEDPSNKDPKYTRVRIREKMPEFAKLGLGAARIAKTAGILGRDRKVLEETVAGLLAVAARPDPAGFVRFDASLVMAAPKAVGIRALVRLLAMVGGGVYPPRQSGLDRLYGEIASSGHSAPFKARTLAGCRILATHQARGQGQGGSLLVCREARAQEDDLCITGPSESHWDGRFLLRFGHNQGAQGNKSRETRLLLGPLGRDGWAEIKNEVSPNFAITMRSIPDVVRQTLPAVFDQKGVLEVPHFGYRRLGRGNPTLRVLEISPFSAIALAGPAFGVLETLS